MCDAMGFSCITAGPWLTRQLRQSCGADADYFDLAVDHEIYYPRPVDRPDHPRVCFYARPSTPRRLVPIGVEALRRVCQCRSDVEIVFYGASDVELAEQPIPFPYTNRGILTEDKLSELFSSSDVGLVLSPTNCSRVPLEMMACKCAVVDLNRETVQGVLEHEVNALLADPTPKAIAEAILRLLDDEPLRLRLVETAYRQIQERSWDKSARRVEAILYEKLSGSRQILAERRSVPLPGLPATADLPSGQRERLEAIHAERKRPGAQWRARIKGWVKRLLRVDQGSLLNRKPIQTIGELTGKGRIGQSFVAQHDHLCRIDVLVGAYDRRNTRDVIFHLRASPTSTSDLATVQVNASLLADNDYASFVFEPQPDSRGKSYYFCVESPESAPGDAITLWVYCDVNLPDTKLYRGNHSISGQLIFGLYCVDDRWGEVGERPLQYDLAHVPTPWRQLSKAYRLLVTQGVSGLAREIHSYLRWKGSA